MAASTVLKRSLSDKTDLNTCCIICLKPKNLTSKPTGHQAIIAAAETRSDNVYKHLQSSSLDDHFWYHMDNKCYKSYTRKDALEKVKVRITF